MEKPHIIVVAILFAAAITSSGYNKNQTKRLSVKDFQPSPRPYQGPITIIGIVAGVSCKNSKKSILMDVSEAQSDKPGRDIFYLPVMSTNRTPEAGEMIKVARQLMEHGLPVATTGVKRWKLKTV